MIPVIASVSWSAMFTAYHYYVTTKDTFEDRLCEPAVVRNEKREGFRRRAGITLAGC
jgi:hypothetical protein